MYFDLNILRCTKMKQNLSSFSFPDDEITKVLELILDKHYNINFSYLLSNYCLNNINFTKITFLQFFIVFFFLMRKYTIYSTPQICVCYKPFLLRLNQVHITIYNGDDESICYRLFFFKKSLTPLYFI